MDISEDAVAGYMEQYLEFLKWRVGDPKSLLRNVASKDIETAEVEFIRMIKRFRGPVRTKPRPDVLRFIREARQSPPPAPEKARKRLKVAKPLKSRRALFVDDEAEEVSHRVAQAEDDANGSEVDSDGNLRDLVADESDIAGSRERQ